jgi:hypothetical protein
MYGYAFAVEYLELGLGDAEERRRSDFHRVDERHLGQ